MPNKDPHYDEQWPLAPIDDHMIHQTPEPIRLMWTSDARVYERYWVTTQDRTGDLLMVFGGSFYPSLNTAEAYAIVNYKGRHTTVRSFRRLGADRMDIHVGPIKPTIVQGLRTWRYVLEENPWGISFDIHWHDTKRQIYRGPITGQSHTPIDSSHGAIGRQPNITAGFEGFGEAEGWVNIHGERINLTRAVFHGTRDRHWGVRDGVGGPGHHVGPRSRPVGPVGGGGGQWVDFGSWALWGGRVFYNFGDPKPGAGTVVKIERKLKFEPDTQLFIEGEITNVLDSGEKKVFHFKRLNNQVAFLRCGMYDGTPEENIWQGMYVGDDVTQGETYDANDSKIRLKIRGNDVHHCQVSCEGQTVSGIFEPHEPGAYENCLKRKPGWSFLD